MTHHRKRFKRRRREWNQIRIRTTGRRLLDALRDFMRCAMSHPVWFVILPIALVVSGFLYAQVHEPLGTLHCDQERHPVWIRVIAHLEGRSTERELEVWACLEDYQAMNEQ